MDFKDYITEILDLINSAQQMAEYEENMEAVHKLENLRQQVEELFY